MKSSKLINSKNLLNIFYIILILVVLVLILEKSDLLNSFENFQTQSTNPTQPTNTTQNTEMNNVVSNDNLSNKTHSKNIYSIIPSPVEDNLYFGTYIPNIKNIGDDQHNNFVYTRSLKSNKWIGKIDNSEIDKQSIIVDLFFDKYKHLMCVAMSMKNKEPIYNIYKKDTIDFRSVWIKVPSNLKMKSLCYNLSGTGNLLGINNYDSQIYENRIQITRTLF